MDRAGLGAVVLLIAMGSGGLANAEDLRARIDKFSRLLREDTSFRIRALSAKKLTGMADEGARGDRRVVDALTACLADDVALVRALCIKGLVKHRSSASVGKLTYLARFDPEDAVKNAAEDAIAELKRQATVARTEPQHRPRKAGPMTVSVGRVEFESAPGVSTQVASLLKKIVRDAVEDQIEPHKPAIFPREDPDLRMDVTIAYRQAEGQLEVRVTLVQLPGAHLRHASRAMARTKGGTKKGSSAPSELERQLALKAASRAVSDALALVYGG